MYSFLGSEIVLWTKKMEQELIILTPSQLKSVIKEVLDEYKHGVQPVQNKWMTATEAAKYMGVNRGYIHMLKREGLIECYNPIPGGIVRFSTDQCDAFIKSTNLKNKSKE